MRLAHDDVLAQRVVGDTQRWLERAVIGLNLCPFAKAVWARSQIHFAVSAANDARGLLNDLERRWTNCGPVLKRTVTRAC